MLLLPFHILQTAQVLVYFIVAYICHLSTQGVEAGELGVQGQTRQGELKASLDCMRPCLKFLKKELRNSL